MRGLKDVRVVEHTGGTSVAYCAKLFVDAGADVIKLEPPEGDPLRRWSASGGDFGAEDGAFFRYLNAGKRSVIGALESEPGLVAGADLVIEDLPPGAYDRQGLLARHPGLVLVSITPFGLTGPLAGRPATDFTIQAESGSLGCRRRPDGDPYQAGSGISGWTGGSFGAVAALAAVRRAQATGHGEHVDLSLQAGTALVTNSYLDQMWSIIGRPPALGSLPNVETPSIEPTRDGFVGFTTYSAQQLSDFLLMIGRTDLRETGEFSQFAQRLARYCQAGWGGCLEAHMPFLERRAAASSPV